MTCINVVIVVLLRARVCVASSPFFAFYLFVVRCVVVLLCVVVWCRVCFVVFCVCG